MSRPHPMSHNGERKGSAQVSHEMVREALSVALKCRSVVAWNRYYDLAVKYKGGKVTRKDIEAAVYAKHFAGSVRGV